MANLAVVLKELQQERSRLDQASSHWWPIFALLVSDFMKISSFLERFSICDMA